MRWAWTFLAISALWVGTKFVLAHWPRSFDACVDELVDGDADRGERADCLETVRDEGVALAISRERARPAVLAAVAAILLGDEGTYHSIVRSQRGGSLLPGVPAAAVVVDDELTLGEARIGELLRGFVAENAGDRVAAATHFGRARDSALLSHDPLTMRIADEALARVR